MRISPLGNRDPAPTSPEGCYAPFSPGMGCATKGLMLSSRSAKLPDAQPDSPVDPEARNARPAHP